MLIWLDSLHSLQRKQMRPPTTMSETRAITRILRTRLVERVTLISFDSVLSALSDTSTLPVCDEYWKTPTRLTESPRVGRGRASHKSPRQMIAVVGGVRRRWGMPDPGVSLSTRLEITKKYAAAYEGASTTDKSRILGQLVEVTGWNRDHARQQLKRRLKQAVGRGGGRRSR